MSGESNEPGYCVDINTSKKIDMCKYYRAGDEKGSCHTICVSNEEMQQISKCDDTKVSWKVGCKSPHCAIYTPPVNGPVSKVFSEADEDFQILEQFCNAEQKKVYNDAISKAYESGNSIEVCCGVKSPDRQLGAIIGGTVAGVVVVAAVAVVVWMAVAKKGCFAKKNKTDAAVKTESTVLQ